MERFCQKFKEYKANERKGETHREKETMNFRKNNKKLYKNETGRLGLAVHVHNPSPLEAAAGW